MRALLGISAALAMAWVAACDSSDPSDAVPIPDTEKDLRSGARLKLMRTDVGGVKRALPQVAFDSELEAECTVARWANGNLYCTPGALHTISASFKRVYADAACTVPMGHVTGFDCHVARATEYFLSRGDATCGEPDLTALHRGTLSNQRTYFIPGGDDRCLSREALDGEHLYTLDELPASELVQVTRVPSEADDRFQLIHGESADGARLFLSVFDTELDGDCSMFPNRDGVQCVANALTTNNYDFADATCSREKPAFRTSCPPTKNLLVYGDSVCGGPKKMFRIAGPDTSPQLYRSIPDGTCVSSTPARGYDYYNLGEQVELPTLSPAEPISAGPRLQRVDHLRGDLRIGGHFLYDTELDIACVPQKMPDGSERCLPGVGYIERALFSDAACTTPLEVFGHIAPPNCSALPAPRFVSLLNEQTCPSTYEVRPVGAAHIGQLYLLAGDSCLPSTFHPSVIFHKLDKPEPLSTFATLGPSSIDP